MNDETSVRDKMGAVAIGAVAGAIAAVVAAGFAEVVVIAFSSTRLAYRWFGGEGPHGWELAWAFQLFSLLALAPLVFVCWKVEKMQVGSEPNHWR